MNLLVLYCVVSAAVNALTSFGLGFYVIATNPRPLASRTFFGFAMSVGLWSLCYTFWHLSTQMDHALFWVRGLMAGAIFIPTFFIHFVITLLGVDSGKRRLVRFSYVLSTVFFLSDLTPLFAKEVVPRSVFPFWPVPGLFFHPYLLHFAGSVIYAHYLMYRDLQVSSGGRRNQVKYVALGTLLGFAGGASNFPLWYNLPIPPIGNALVALYVALTAYSIARYRLLDINIWLARVAIFLVAYVPLLLLPFIGGALLQPALAGWLGLNWWMVPTALEALVAVAGLLVYRKMTQRAENRILAEEREYQQLLLDAAHGMLDILDPRKLISFIAKLVMRHVKVTHVAIYFQEQREMPYRLQTIERGAGTEQPIMAFDPEDALISYLEAVRVPVLTEELLRAVQEGKVPHLKSVATRLGELKAALVVPGFLRNHLLGFILLGAKRSGQVYSPQDLKVFEILGEQAAIALQHARFYGSSLASEMYQSLKEVLNGINHEIGNLLNILSAKLAPLHLPTALQTPEERLALGLDISATLERGKQWTEEIRNYQKLMRSPAVKSYAPYRQLFEPLLGLPKQVFPKRDNIRVALDCPEDLPKIEGLPILPDLFRHLVINACWSIEALPVPEGGVPKGGTITLKAHCPDRKTLEVEMTDPGELLLPHLQHPEEFDGGTYLPQRGKLGAIHYFLARMVVLEHSGNMEISTLDDGKGTHVLIQLPLAYIPPSLKEEGGEAGGEAAEAR